MWLIALFYLVSMVAVVFFVARRYRDPGTPGTERGAEKGGEPRCLLCGAPLRRSGGGDHEGDQPGAGSGGSK